MMKMHFPLRSPACARALLLCLVAAGLPLGTRAALSDEIQVYTDDINAAQEFGLELHANFTPSGRSIPDYSGEAVPDRGLRLTPEFSYGLTAALEAGLYLPVNRDAAGNVELAGAKLRLKWVPMRSREGGGWYLGANGELSRLRPAYSPSRDSFELRLMTGYRNAEWLIAVNPVFGWGLTEGYSGQSPDFSLATKVAKTIAPGLSVGSELYCDMGTAARVVPWPQQTNTLFATVDWKVKGWEINAGIGWGLTAGADAHTVKVIFGIPL